MFTPDLVFLFFLFVRCLEIHLIHTGSSLLLVEILYAEGDGLQLVILCFFGQRLRARKWKQRRHRRGKRHLGNDIIEAPPIPLWGWGICLVHVSKPKGTWLSFLHLCHPAYRIQAVLERIAEQSVKRAVLRGGSKHIFYPGQHTPAQKRDVSHTQILGAWPRP